MATDAGAGVARVMLGAAIALIIVVLAGYLALSRPSAPAVPVIAAGPVAAPDPGIAPDQAAPRITDVRVDPDGAAVVAGFAIGGMPVEILIDAAPMMRVIAEPNGAFVALTTFAPSGKPRRLSLVADPDGSAVASDDEIILAPLVAAVSEAPGNPVALARTAETDGGAELDDGLILNAPETRAMDVMASATAAIADVMVEDGSATAIVAGADMVEDAATVATNAATKVANDPVPDTDELAGASPATLAEPAAQTELETRTVNLPSAPAILQSDADGVRLLQPAIAADTPPEVMSSVALDSIAYDPTGEVSLSGRAGAAGFVRIYLDNVPVSDTPVAPSGTWAIDMPQIDSGVYTLRIDQVDAAGSVVSRIETPFQREEPAAIAAAMVDQTPDGFAVAVKTVQPGATLWAIARDRYGEGIMYLRVFEANRDRIRNPDLIYPGQVFVIPEAIE